MPAIPASINATVTWHRVHPDDVQSALKTLSSLGPSQRIIAYRGEDVDTQLAWAVAELELAENSPATDDCRRHAVQAVGHAKRAMDCLFDAYLERDFLNVHLPERAPFSAKIELLKKRLGHRLPWRLIPAIVAGPRDLAEHERQIPTVQTAGVAVEAARMVVAAMVSASDPLIGPALLGSFLGGQSSGPRGRHVWVTGFPSVFAWAWNCADGVSRVGVGRASARDTAEMIFADLVAFTDEEHIEVLRIFDTVASSSVWAIDEGTMRLKMQLAGLDQPK